MSSTTRRRRAASLVTTAALALALPAVGSTILAAPAQSADPASDCIAPYPIADLVPGDPVTGRTVVTGSTPVGFTGEVLGVIDDGIGPDLDLVMVDLDMPEFARSGGVWQGMSGSPVYAADGRLIGAVAYGLAYGPSPIAGITPFEDMDDYLGTTPPRRVALGSAAARRVAAHAGVTQRQAAQGFRELPMPTGVSGISARRLAQLRAKGPRFLKRDTYLLGRASAAAAGPETMVAGGNLGVSAAYGDVAMAGVGTVTSVCEGRVVGFGHPMAMLGSTTMGLHPADAIYVQPDSLGSPFKVANLGPVVGTVTDDRLTGVTGTFGPAPTAASIVSSVTYGGRSRTGSTSVYVPDFVAEATLYQMVVNQDRVVDGPSNGSQVLSWRITGTERGRPFALTYTDRFTTSELSLLASLGLAEFVYSLGSLEGVTIGSVTTQAAVTDVRARHTLRAVQQRRAGTWVPVTRREPAVAKAGGKIRLRVVLGGSAGRQIKHLRPIAVPKRTRDSVMLVAQGGDDLWSSPQGSSVKALRASLARELRNDQVRVQVGTPDRVDLGMDGEEIEFFRGPARRPTSFVRSRATAPLTHVVGGMKMLQIVVR